MSNWPEFVSKLTVWADRESNNIGLRFSVSSIDNDTLRIVSTDNKTKFGIMYTKKEYMPASKAFTDEEILANIFQTLREKYRNLNKRYNMNYYFLRCKRKK